MSLEKCKYVAKEKKMSEDIITHIEISFDEKYFHETNFNEENSDEEIYNEEN